jgi:4-alpha-glucanotransferase
LTVEASGSKWESLVLCAPERSYELPSAQKTKTWGIFAPLYALHSEESLAAGDFSDLGRLHQWVQGLGGGIVATLPLLAAFLDEPFEPAPYTPASRLFWNEFYLALRGIPELAQCEAAQRILLSDEFIREKARLKVQRLVEYHDQMTLKRRALSELARHFFKNPGKRREAFDRFVAARPEVEDYAQFRAVGERRKAPWPAWPAPLCDGVITPDDFDLDNKNYHLYVQWLAEEQLQSLAANMRQSGLGLYLDLPLGVHSDSYDSWREREAFASGIAAGAPPDTFFSEGQNWGFAPLHPQRSREQGYRYFISYLRHHLRLAGVLRLDHMMGLHRLYWIPHGMHARDGIYVQYPAEELYAILSLESHKSRSLLVGEDLGTVPPEVRPAMTRHNIGRMYVMQYEIQPHAPNPLTPIPDGSVASFNTHDMFPFAGFWQGLDIQERVDLGHLSAQGAEGERGYRSFLIAAMIRSLKERGLLKPDAEPADVFRACLEFMGQSPAMFVLVTLEDLWLETQPQNIPGTWRERPNWRRRGQKSFDEFTRMPQVLEALHTLNAAIKKQ